MDLSLVIVSYNTRDLLKENLGSIMAARNGHDFEVLVVDNHSSDGTPEMVRSEFPDVSLLSNDLNRGFAGGVNQGIAATVGRYVMVLNADTKLPQNGINKLLDFAEAQYREQKVGIVGPKLLNADGSLQYSKGRFPNIARTIADAFKPRNMRKYTYTGYDRPGETDWVTGACVLLRRELIEDVGPLDENFFLYYEDVDLCWRARSKGWKVVFYPDYEVRHFNPYARRDEKRAFVPVEIRRSHLYFYKKNYSPVSFQTLWLMTFAWVTGSLVGSRLPILGGNGSADHIRMVQRRVLKEVLFNGKINGNGPHRPEDAG